MPNITEATKLRDKAYRARRSEFEAVRDAAKNADAAMDAALEKRNEELAAITRQIEALQQQLRDTEKKHDGLLQPLRENRRQAWAAYSQVERAARQSAEEAFPDVASVFSGAAWKDFNEFIPQVDKSKLNIDSAE